MDNKSSFVVRTLSSWIRYFCRVGFKTGAKRVVEDSPSRHFRLETFEPRVLLSADLVAGLNSAPDPNLHLPGETLTVNALVRNIGDAMAPPVIRIDLSASLDATLSNNDILINSTLVQDSLPPQTDQSVPLLLTLPQTLRPGNYALFAVADPANQIPESDESNNASAPGNPITVAWQFGQVPGRTGNSTLSIVADDGTEATFSLPGGGLGTVDYDTSGFQINLTGTTALSELQVQIQPGSGPKGISGIHVDAALKSIQLGGISLKGDIQVEGSLSLLNLGDIIGPSEIRINGVGSKLDVHAGHIQNLGFTSNTPIGQFIATEWLNTDGTADILAAPTLSALKMTNAFQADLHIGTLGATSLVLSSANIGGTVSSHWTIQGRAGSIVAGTAAQDWSAAFTGPVSGLQIAGDASGFVSTPSLLILQVGGNLNQATFLIGANLGADGKPGGTGIDADQFGQGVLSRLRVTGNVLDSLIRVGINPVDGLFDNGNDEIAGGTKSRIQEMIVGGKLLGTTQIIAGAFPASVKINGQTLNPATVPALQTRSKDEVVPILEAALANDTGLPLNDGITRDPTVTGTANDLGGLVSLKAGFDAALLSTYVDKSNQVGTDGRFTLDAAHLAAISPGGLLTDGAHTLHLIATDLAGNSTNRDIAFTLDTTAPAVSAFGLAAASDTGTVGDGITEASNVTLTGQSEAGAQLALRDGQNSLLGNAVADNAGSFSFAGIALSLGANSFSLTASDAAGNSAQSGLTLTRSSTEGVDTTPPVLTAALANDTGVANTDGMSSDPTVQGKVTDDNSAPVKLLVALDPLTPDAALTNLSALLDAGGNYQIDSARLATLAGDTLTNGAHSLRLVAEDGAGIRSPVTNLNFTLDTVAPSISTVDLSASSDTGVSGDGITAASRVTLAGNAEVGAMVSLGTIKAVAGASGVFQLTDVALADGVNALNLTVTDAVGNTSQSLISITKEGSVSSTLDVALTWNNQALEAVRQDVTDPPIATRILALVSLAQYDTLAAIEGSPAYLVQHSLNGPVNTDVALTKAAQTVLDALFPAHRDSFDAALAQLLAGVPDGAAKTNALALGQDIAQSVLALREHDGSDAFIDYNGSNEVGKWRTTAPMYLVAEEPYWGDVTPFALTSADQYRPPAPPSLDSATYSADVNEIQRIGSATSSTRTADQTQQVQFWADGKGSYTPPGHWNIIAEQIAQAQGNSLAANVLLFAKLNVALADAAIACWDAKYTYGLWRPIDAIQHADQDNNSATTVDSNWTPLLITPPHPEYVSGHSTFSMAAATVLADSFGDNTAFSTTAYTLPGVTRSYTSFTQAAQESGRSRVFGGIHYEFTNLAGQQLGQHVGQAVLARFALTEDQQAPAVSLQNTAGAVNTNLTLTGQIIDNLSGVASAQYRIDGGDLQALTLTANGNFTITTAFALDGSQDGPHIFTILARDAAGNTNTGFMKAFTLDTQAPALALTSVDEGSIIDAASHLTGTASGTGSALVALDYRLDNGPARSLVFNPADGRFDQALLLGDISVGGHTLMINATDAVGNSVVLARGVTVETRIPFAITQVTPTDGSGDVGVTFRPLVAFSRAVDKTTLTTDTFYATGPDGAKLAATIVPALDGSFAWLFFAQPLPGAAIVTLHLDGSRIHAASDGQALDGDGDGNPGGQWTSQFTTVSTAGVFGTKLLGRVVDPGADLEPMTFDDIRRGPDGVIHTPDDMFLNSIAHAKVFILGREDRVVYTDAEGRFELDNVPTGDVKLAVDGRTATNAPAGIFWPEMVLDVTVRPGISNTAMGGMGTAATQQANADRREIYLPRVQTASLQTVSQTAPTTINVDAKSAPDLSDEQRSRLTLTVNPGSAVGFEGQALSDVKIGVSTVPPELVKDMLPPGVLEHTFDITIQAPGVDAFTQPVQITFPNVFGAAPGTKLNILSFDHTTGRLVINGTGTVGTDGLTVVSDPESGVKAPGWHGLTPPGGPAGPECNPSATHDIDTTPVPVMAGVKDYLVTNEGAVNPLNGSHDEVFTLSFGNAAKPLAAGDPCSPENMRATPLIVTITVEGNNGAEQFMDLTTRTFQLAPNQQQNIHVRMRKLLTNEQVNAATTDKLYGATVRIGLWKFGDPIALEQKEIYIYRFFDIADDHHTDGRIDFPKAFVNDDVIQKVPLQFVGPDSAKPSFVTTPVGSDFSYGSNTVSFNPSVPGQRTEDLVITNPKGKEVGKIGLQGTGADIQFIILRKDLLTTAIASIVDLSPLPPILATFVSLFPSDGPDAGSKRSDEPGFQPVVNEIWAATSLYVGKSFAQVSPEAGDALVVLDSLGGQGQIINSVVVGSGINLAGGNAPAAATWADFKKSTFISTLLPQASSTSLLQEKYRLGSITNRDYSDVGPGGALPNGLSIVENIDLLAGYISGSKTPLASFERLFGNAITHEVGHNLGAIHLRDRVKDYIRGNGDVMGKGGSDNKAGHTFITFAPLVKYALGLPVSDKEQQAIWDYERKYIPLETYAFNNTLIAPEDSAEDLVTSVPILDVHLGPLVLGGDLPDEVFSGVPLDFGSINVDGPGGESRTFQISLANGGGEPLIVDDVSFAAASIGFSIEGEGVLPFTLAPIDPEQPDLDASTRTITLRFDPTISGDAKTKLRIRTNSLSPEPHTSFETEEFQLTGRGTPANPVLGIELPQGNNLGGQQWELTEQDLMPTPNQIPAMGRLVRLHNDGVKPLAISDLRLVEGAGTFSLHQSGNGQALNLPSAGVILQPGEEFEFRVWFNADHLGLTRGIIEVLSNDPQQPALRFSMVGTGTEAVPRAKIGNDYIAIENTNLAGNNQLLGLGKGNTQFRLRSDSAGGFEVFLPPQQDYLAQVFDPETGLTGVESGRTLASGQRTPLLRTLYLDASRAPDSDYDGLPDDIEFAIGTSASKADTDGNGLDDFTEIMQGLDPLGGKAFPTGVIASLALGGPALDVVVKPATADPAQLIAYVATDNMGLSLVDVTRFDKPVQISQVNLVGNAIGVGVDAAAGIAAVLTSDGSLKLVDVANPQVPTVLRNIDVSAGQVEVADGVAYVGTDSHIRAYELRTGRLLSTLDLPGVKLTGLAHEGNFVYALDDQGVLRVIDHSGPALNARGSLTLPQGGGKLFAGGGIVYANQATRANGGPAPRGGYATVDVANPDHPLLLSGSDLGPNETLPSAAVAATGSGQVVLAGRPFGRLLPPALALLDSADLTRNNGLLTSIALPADAGAVALTNGKAFVAGSTAGLVVVNFVSFDVADVPPTVSLNPAVVDADPNLAGLQVLEGSRVPLSAQAVDDVQVARVELLQDGKVVRTVIAFPYDLSIVAPPVIQGSVTLQVRATDTGGNVALSTPLTLGLLADNTPPELTFLDPAEGIRRSLSYPPVVELHFSKPMDEARLRAAVQLIGPDGLAVAPKNVSFRNDNTTLQLSFEKLAIGAYEIRILAAEATDRAGNPLAGGDKASHFTVSEVSAVWTAPGGGRFADAANWASGQVPGFNDDVLIDVPEGAVIIYDIGAGGHSVQSLRVKGGDLSLTGGTLAVLGRLEVDGAFKIDGGTLMNATVVRPLGASPVVVGTSDSSRFDGVTLQGDLDLAANGAKLRLSHRFALDGTARVSGNLAGFGIEGSVTIVRGAFHFDGIFGETGNGFEAINGAGSLVLGEGVNVFGRGMHISNSGPVFLNPESRGLILENRGLISADVVNPNPNLSSPTVDIVISTNVFHNFGTVQARNGSGLVIRSEGWVNEATGILRADDGGYLGLRASLDVEVQGSGFLGSWRNDGLIAGTGGRIDLDADWSNAAGTIRTSDTWLAINHLGNLTPAQLGRIEAQAGAGRRPELNAVIDNRDNTLRLGAANGQWAYRGGIIGGTVELIDGITIQPVNEVFSTNPGVKGSAFLDGVVLKGNIEFVNVVDAVLHIRNFLDLDGQIRFSEQAAGGRMIFHGTQTLARGSIIGLSPSFLNGLLVSDGGTLTLGPAVTGTGTFGISGDAVVNQGSLLANRPYGGIGIAVHHFENRGVLHATGHVRDADGRDIPVVLSVFANNPLRFTEAGSFLNTGTLIVENGALLATGADANIDPRVTQGTPSWINAGNIIVRDGMLELGGILRTSNLGTFERDRELGIVKLVGVLDNADQTLDVDAVFGGTLQLVEGSRIVGGVINLASPGQLLASGGILRNVTINGDPAVSLLRNLHIVESLTLNGTMTIEGTLFLDGDVTLHGGTYFISPDASGFPNPEGIVGEGTVSFDSGVVVTGSKRGILKLNRLINRGTIRADAFFHGAGPTSFGFSVDVARLQNDGVIEALNGGVLSFTLNDAFTNTGVLRAGEASTIGLIGRFSSALLTPGLVTGPGILEIRGTIVNTGRVLILDGSMPELALASGTIEGGTVSLLDGRKLRAYSINGISRLVGVTVDGDIDLTAPPPGVQAALNIEQGLTLHGVARLKGGSNRLSLLNFVGTQTFAGGTIELLDQAYLSNRGGTLTVAPDAILRGTSGSMSFESLVNLGTIDADG